MSSRYYTRALSTFGKYYGRKSSSWNQKRQFSKDVFEIREEVAEALYTGKPVVALESTIITHGMPYPHNLSTASYVENIIREEGVVPATIAVVKGKVKVGLSYEELELLAVQDESCLKTSRRDLSYVLSQGLNGGTTVSGTMVIAHQVGIPIFVTGGIGGVHRGAESSMDVSADLTELGRTPITVISTGVKSILDIGRTLEYLETEGVCVATFGKSKNFPAFFVPESGYQSPFNITDEAQVAELIDAHHSLDLGSGILIAVPIPQVNAVDGQQIESAIQTALIEAGTSGIVGKDVTPYVLRRINEMTEGASLTANIALVKNNAIVGSRIAKELSDIKKRKTPNSHTTYSTSLNTGNTDKSSLYTETADKSSLYTETAEQSSLYTGTADKSSLYTGTADKSSLYTGTADQSERVVVVGGSIVDFYAKIAEENVELNGATYPGYVQQSFGGVGRNIADCLSRLGANPFFISATGADANRTAYEAYCDHMDLSGVASLSEYKTATYCAVLRNGGELMFGIGDMDIHKQITPDYISQFVDKLKSAPLVVVDGNIPTESIEYICKLCHENRIPVWFEPTDVHKATKPFMTSAVKHLTYISPNMNELRSIYLHLTSTKPSRIGHSDPDSVSLEGIVDEALWLSEVIVEEVPVVMVTLGKHGVMLCQNTSHEKLPIKGYTIQNKEKMTADIFPAFDPNSPPQDIASVSGAGDCLAAAMINGIVKGHDPDICIKAGLMAAQMSLKSYHAVPHIITPDELTIDKIKLWAPWQPERAKRTSKIHEK